MISNNVGEVGDENCHRKHVLYHEINIAIKKMQVLQL